MKAITTKYLAPTNFKGARIKAYDLDGNQVTIRYDYSLNNELAHRKAAFALCKKMNWETNLVDGTIKGGYVFVFTH